MVAWKAQKTLHNPIQLQHSNVSFLMERYAECANKSIA